MLMLNYITKTSGLIVPRFFNIGFLVLVVRLDHKRTARFQRSCQSVVVTACCAVIAECRSNRVTITVRSCRRTKSLGSSVFRISESLSGQTLEVDFPKTTNTRIVCLRQSRVFSTICPIGLQLSLNTLDVSLAFGITGPFLNAA